MSTVTADNSEGPRASLRVAVFSGAYCHIADGVSLTLNDLVDHLGGRGIPCRVFAPTAGEPALDHAGTLTPVPSVPVPGRSEYRLTLGLTPSVRESLAEFRPNLFHVAAPDPLGLQAVRLARSEDVPVAGTFNTHFPSYLKYYGFGALERAAWCYLRHFYQQCDQVYVPTTVIRDVLRAQGIESDIRLWRRGIELDRFTPARRSASWREAHGLDGDDVVVTFVSRLVREKGLGTLARVVRRLEREDVPHRSVVVGDGPLREELEERLPDTIFTGFLEGAALAQAYASSDVFLFPSDTETFGRVTLEAMASGLPAVCADAGGSRELVADGRTGLLCPPGDVDAFAEAVRRLVLDPALRWRMGEAAVDRADGFGRDEVMAQVVRHYADLVSPERPREGPAAAPRRPSAPTSRSRDRARAADGDP